jgi:uncharacterized membrane protein YebE (DUF533 family)
MGYNVLKMLIESACADGLVTEREYMHLKEQAREDGITDEKLNVMIRDELNHVNNEILAQRSGILTSGNSKKNI